ncbi:SDR family oxidoreductase [Thalassoroseus pseudoceratinae]|uniref:SDR family oxidoreductase n=1 Tax=Thalassoroseus pseudoceratinae TaxID=2713176 RepID=UPI00141E7DBF|nr:SDR family oxidoreductase [Thalassoroseus pseudoceratinae]
MPYTLITGVTGLLGQYLLRDLLEKGEHVAVLVRSTPLADACARVEGILTAWESRLKRCLPRPRVLNGDLTSHDLGLNEDDARFVREHCDSVLHNAASLVFHGESRDGEPYRTNVVGTRNLVRTALDAGVERFHHVSTAYVCGQRHGSVAEIDADANADFGNDYERSKAEAESIVRNAFGDRATIYRPSVIVGDSETGFTSTYRGFYTAVQLTWLLAKTNGTQAGREFIRNLGFSADDRKNLVPVEWVSRAIIEIKQNASQVGRVFHITNPALTSTSLIEEAINTAIEQSNLETSDGRTVKRTAFREDELRAGMDVYRSYFRTDPLFDCRNTQAALPNLPCPVVDRSMLVRLCRWAMDAKFSTLPPRATIDAPPIGAVFRSAFEGSSAGFESDESLQLELTGPGGGQWTVMFEGGRPVCANSASHDFTKSLIYGPSSALWTLVSGRESSEQLLAEGSLVLEGDSQSRSRLDALVEHLRVGLASNRRAS